MPRRLGAGCEQRVAFKRGAELPPHRRQKGERLRAEGLRPGRRQIEDTDRPRTAQERHAGVQLEPRLVAGGSVQTAAPHDVDAGIEPSLPQQPLAVAAAGTERTVAVFAQCRRQTRGGRHRKLTLMPVALYHL